MAERMLFKRLPPAPRRKILSYIDAPSYESWVAVRDIRVAHGLTLFDVTEVVDRDFSWFGHVFPSGILVARASRWVDEHWADREASKEWDILPPPPLTPPVA